MSQIPSELVQAIQGRDCVLWAGAGFGALAGRPGWNELLGTLIDQCAEDVRASLSDLREQGRLRTVLSYIHRHHGDTPLVNLLKQVADEPGETKALAPLAELPWRAIFATAYADVLYEVLVAGGQSMDVLAHVDVHDLSLRGDGRPFILRTPPTGRSMRADQVFFELVEEVVRTRTILFMGFDIDDPDLIQILALLDRVGRGRRHYAWLPYVSVAESEEILEQYGIHVIAAEPDQGLAQQLGGLSAAMADVAPRPSSAAADIATLELSRALARIDVRADLALDDALTLEVEEIDALLQQIPSGTDIDPRTQLRVGTVLMAHDRLDRAQQAFRQVVSRGTGREYEAIARFNLALLAASENDESNAVEGLISAAEELRTLAMVPPRFSIEGLRGRDGARLMLSCRDRESGELVDVVVSTLGRPASSSEQARFYEEVQRFVEIEHPAIRHIRGGFADGRLFGIFAEPQVGFELRDVLRDSDGPMSLERGLELLGPIFEGLALCHDQGAVHRNIHPRHILVGPKHATLRGFGFAPVTSYRRPSVLRANLGYVAPEAASQNLLGTAGDVYALAAVMYRCVSGRSPEGHPAPASTCNPRLDSRVDAILANAMHPDPKSRPKVGQLRAQLEEVLTAPDRAPKAAQAQAQATKVASPAKVVSAPHAPATTAAPAGDKIAVPDDPNDLEAWTWILERKPNHMEAREAVERIEIEARDQGRWDLVAEVLNVRAQLAQAQDERIGLLRELAQIFEHSLGAPRNALDTLMALLDEVSLSARLDLCDDLWRLAEVTGGWSEVADAVASVAASVSEPSDRARLHADLGRVYLRELSSVDRAIVCFETAHEAEEDQPGHLEQLVELYRQAGRSAEVATTLLTLAELEEAGPAKHAHLVEAARLLESELGAKEEALEAVELVLAEDPEQADALEVGESLARELERWSTLADILTRRGRAVFDEGQAKALRREAAEVMLARLDDAEGAITTLSDLLATDRTDAESARKLIELLEARVEDDPTRRAPLAETLLGLAEQTEADNERMRVLARAASLLDQMEDGSDRAADCREQIVATLPADDALAVSAAQGLETYFRGQAADHALAELYESRAKSGALPPKDRVEWWKKLLELRRGPLDDPAGQREALEALLDLEPEQIEWRDHLVERFLADGDHDKASEMIEAQVRSTDDPARRAMMMVHAARLKCENGEFDEAEKQVQEALSLDPGAGRGWALLREIYESTSQPLKAVDAQIRAAQAASSPGERAKGLFEAGRACIEVLAVPERGVPLLEEAIAADPDHRGATKMLLQHLISRGELERSWPTAQTYLTQVRAQTPDDRQAQVDALGIAGRCAVAVGDHEKAREYLAEAKSLVPGDLSVVGVLADLELEAGNFEAALKGYQTLALTASSALSTPEQASVYLRMGKARAGMGERAKALQMLERALDIDPDYEPAARAMVELSADRPADQAKGMVLLAEILIERATQSSPEAQGELRQQAVDILRDAAGLYADALNRPADALDQLERVLELQKPDISVLHQMLDLYTSAERWFDAAQILERLADLQDMSEARAKYLYAGAVIVRDHLDDHQASKEWMRKVLVADPLHEKAFRAESQLLAEEGSWKELSRLLRERLKSLPDDAEPEDRVALLDQLGEIYRDNLEDPKTALAAFEQGIALSPPTRDGEELADRRRQVVALALQQDQLDKAIDHQRALIVARPQELNAYHELFDLYRRTDQPDGAQLVSRALRFLKKANEDELAAAAEGEALPKPRGSLTREIWRQCLYHRDENSRLSDLFSLVWPVVAIRAGQTHAHFKLERSDRVTVNAQAEGIARYVAHACQVLDVPVPHLFLRPGKPGGFSVKALTDKNVVYPSLLAGEEALGKQDEAASVFRAARAVTLVQPEHILASVLVSGPGLRDAVYAAMLATQPNVAVPPESLERAKAYAEQLVRLLPPARMDTIKTLVARVIEAGAADTRRWIVGVDYTAARVGFLMCGSLEVAARVLVSGSGEGTSVKSEEIIRELVSYSVSEQFLRARRSLKIK